MNEKIKTEVFDILNRIDQIFKCSPLLKQLEHLVEIECYVVGGAVRDLILEKNIKDVDIAVTLNFWKNLKVNYRTSRYYEDDPSAEIFDEANALEERNIQVMKLLSEEQFSMIHPKIKGKDNKIVSDAIDAVIYLIEHVISQVDVYHIEELFDKTTLDIKRQDLKDMAYHEVGLNAVMKLQDKNTNFPIELLLTPNAIDSFVDSFDFNICKAYIDVSAEITKTNKFLEDVESKKITYAPLADITDSKIEKSLLIRYPRLHKKFSEYELVCDITSVPKEFKTMVEEHVKSVSLYHKILNETKEPICFKKKNQIKI